MCAKNSKLNFISPGYPVLFEMLKAVLIITFIQCIFAFYKSEVNWAKNKCGTADSFGGVTCSKNQNMAGISVANYGFSKDTTDAGLSFCMLLLICILYGLFAWLLNRYTSKMSIDNVVNYSYTIWVEDVPSGTTEASIKNAFNQAIKDNSFKGEVDNVTCSYRIYDWYNKKLKYNSSYWKINKLNIQKHLGKEVQEKINKKVEKIDMIELDLKNEESKINSNIE